MNILIALLAIVFIVLTALVVGRTQKIIKGLDKSTKEVDNEYLGAPDTHNDANGIGLLAFWVISIVGIVWSFMDAKKDFLPEASSEHGLVTDYWFWVSMVVIMIGFFIINTVLFYFSYKYRYKIGRKVTFYTHNNNLEAVWTAIPAVIMAGLVFSGLRVWTKIMDDAPANAEVIEIMGKQFAWTVRYPGASDNKLGKYNYKLMDDIGGNPMGVDFADANSFDDFSNTSELHVPKGKPVLLKIRSRDVLHSVFIPHMRVKMDAVPGMPTKFWFTPIKSTDDMRAELGDAEFNYEIACTEVCGRSHFGMKLLLVVDEPAEYEKWKRSQKPLLTENSALLDKVPANLKAKALKYIVQDTPPAVATTIAIADSSSSGNTSKILK
jgi:cytochrome c oxidase subunit II